MAQSLKDMMYVNPSVATNYLKYALGAGLVPFIEGSPGIGKSQIVKQVAKEAGLKVIDLRLSMCDVTDLMGLPRFSKKGDKDIAEFAPFNIFPTDKDSVPKGYNGFLLFLDEFNSASEEVQAASYKLILDRQVGMYSLHPDCYVVCAGNGKSDRAITHEMSTAMVSRLVHIRMKTDIKCWMENVALPRKYDPRIIAYLNMQPDSLMDFKPENDETRDKTFCCPRSWEFVDKLLKTDMEVSLATQPLLAGVISEGEAVKFTQFCLLNNKITKYEDILSNPTNAMVPGDTSSRWLVISSIAQQFNSEKTTELEKIHIYMNRFGDKSMYVLCIRMLKTRYDLSNQPFFHTILSDLADYMLEDNNE